jgi:Rrf2 family iron-sulfur cluster assembly transcriptional regulator
VAEIIDAVNESVDATNCTGKGNCQAGEVCLTHHLWQNLSDKIHDFLSEITLEQLTDSHNVQQICDRQNLKVSLDLTGGEGLIKASMMT